MWDDLLKMKQFNILQNFTNVVLCLHFISNDGDRRFY